MYIIQMLSAYRNRWILYIIRMVRSKWLNHLNDSLILAVLCYFLFDWCCKWNAIDWMRKKDQVMEWIKCNDVWFVDLIILFLFLSSLFLVFPHHLLHQTNQMPIKTKQQTSQLMIPMHISNSFWRPISFSLLLFSFSFYYYMVYYSINFFSSYSTSLT